MLRSVILFAHNYPHNFIEEVWKEEPMMAQHLRSKFDGYAKWHQNPIALIMKFMAELSSDKLSELEDYIEKNPNFK
jgi:hypothetical protein